IPTTLFAVASSRQARCYSAHPKIEVDSYRIRYALIANINAAQEACIATSQAGSGSWQCSKKM
ncbi:MAG: hypothetical protein ABIQ03_09770, partial [Burkholderiales bacterium]